MVDTFSELNNKFENLEENWKVKNKEHIGILS